MHISGKYFSKLLLGLNKLLMSQNILHNYQCEITKNKANCLLNKHNIKWVKIACASVHYLSPKGFLNLFISI